MKYVLNRLKRNKTIHLIALIVLIILIFNLKSILIYITGSPTPIAVVNGKSMFPTLREGDIVFVYKPKPQDIRVNDVVVYRKTDGIYVIHRVIEVIEIKTPYGVNYYYVTKGDNNPVRDPGRISYDELSGVVFKINGMIFKIPYLGYISIWFNEIRKSLSYSFTQTIFISYSVYYMLYNID